MIHVSDAINRLVASAQCSKPSERVLLGQALGRVASQNVVSKIQIPPSDNSAMDGFAVNSADFSKNNPALQMPVSQRIAAGSAPTPLKLGTAARIFTGGVIPDGADAVIIQENCEYNSPAQVTFNVSATKGENIRPAGQDLTTGAIVVKQGQRLNPVDLSLLASIGHADVEVYEPLKVAIFSTGDELIEPGNELKVGQIYNSNRTLLIALCQNLGLTPIDCGTVEDSLEATKEALLKAAESADVIISSGGVSVGDEDHVKPAVETLGSLDLWKVQMKPGKPVAFGQVNNKPFLGLPGNPVSSFVVFQLLGVPLLRALQGQVSKPATVYKVKSGFDKKTSTREEYIRVRLEVSNTYTEGSSGELVAQRFTNLSSGVMSSLSWADGLVRQNYNQAIESGELVDYLPLNNAML